MKLPFTLRNPILTNKEVAETWRTNILTYGPIVLESLHAMYTVMNEIDDPKLRKTELDRVHLKYAQIFASVSA